MRSNISVGLDVGTSRVCAVVSGPGNNSRRVLGAGISASTGLRKGVVVNMDPTVESIRNAIKEAEASSGVKIRSVSAGISGGHIRGFNSSGAIDIRGKEVKRADIDHAVESAREVYIPLDRDVLHVIQNEFVLDGRDGITDPAGMSGLRLEARVNIITGAISPIENLLKCCVKAGLEVSEIVFGPIASARSILEKDEKESGVVLVDIGGGTSDIALFKGGSLRYASVLGIGGDHITNDIAVGLKINMPEAERLKKESGAAFEGMVDKAEEMQITQAGDQVRTLPRKYIAEIIQPRCEEMLELIKEEIIRCTGYETAVCGVVLTGGSSLLSGFDRMAESVLGLPVRAGLLKNINGLNGEEGSLLYATGVGLAAYDSVPESHPEPHPDVVAGIYRGLKGHVRDMFKYAEYFNFNNKKEGGMLCLKSKK